MNSKTFTLLLISFLAVGSIAVTETNSQIRNRIHAKEIQKEIQKERQLKVSKIKIDTIVSRIDTTEKILDATKQILISNSHILDRDAKKLRDFQEAKSEDVSNPVIILDTIVIQKVIEKEVVKQDSVIIIKEPEEKRNFFQRLFKFLPSKKK